MAFPIQQGLFQFDLIDHYAILGVSLDADVQQIRQRYLKIAYRLHPDTCKAQNDLEKHKASKLLSKLVNPAYEQLSKEQSRLDYLLVLTQIGKNLALENEKPALVTESANKLSQAGNKIDLVYKTLLQSLITNQYTSLEQVTKNIAEISELNLVYLIFKQGKITQSKSQLATLNKPEVKPKEQEETITSPISVYIRRAQECLEKNNVSQAVLELRDALKIDPNNGICHSLMGLAYLKQNQISMARVHINKAWQLNPKDPTVIKSRQELDKFTQTDSKIKDTASHKNTSQQSGSGGILGGLFGGKKK